ncbi:hypothetical protein DFR50_14262 [Roseiarcus fermentans]|uniref:Concanavalin A-like lectin/glucanase superfamily protein n=1 Tax=Roseiarcus fermentans TaxID=1473586 RepID=A0A366ENG3_9HYPH|nr:hypothetical protein [Roseiarcus fermentans]RBP03814.1 hypothetical protein DFR50_14262 [Roseiarcus fermentans]
MSTPTSTKAEFRAGVQCEFDGNTTETVAAASAFAFGDEFVGAGHTAGIPAAGSPAVGYAWVKKIVGAAPPTVALQTNSSGGIIQCTLLATSEIEEASLYFNDSLSVDTTKIGQAEWRAALSVAPSLAGVQAAVGLGSAWVGGALPNQAVYMLFGWTANNALLIWSRDGQGNTYNFAAKPIGGSAIATDTNMHLYRVDWSNPADIAFFVDGGRVNAVGSVVWAATGGAAILQPWHTVYKTASAGLATLSIDKIDIFNGR